jgi:hypothetical protein
MGVTYKSTNKTVLVGLEKVTNSTCSHVHGHRAIDERHFISRNYDKMVQLVLGFSKRNFRRKNMMLNQNEMLEPAKEQWMKQN